MPIYEYQCEVCEHKLEALQKLGDGLLTDCPKCEKPGLKKKISAAGFRLKGSGWYETDFKTGNKKNLVAGSDGVSKGSNSSSSTSSSSKSSGSGSSTSTSSTSNSSTSNSASTGNS